MANNELFAPGEHQFQGYDNTALVYHAKGNGPILILQAGGWGIHSQYLRSGLAPLEKTFTLVCMDSRGSGFSAQPSDATAMSDADMAEDLEFLRKHLGLNKFDLLGHSQGGSVALLYAERYPLRLKKVILLTHKLVGYPGSSEMGSYVKEKRHDPRYAKCIAAIDGPKPDPVADHAAWVKYMSEFLQLYVTDPPKYWHYFCDVMGSPSGWTNKAWTAANKAKAEEVDTYSRLHLVTAKTLCIGCDEDPVCTPHETRITHAGIEGAEVLIIKDSGHFPWIERPDLFFPKVVEFFRG